MSENLSPAQNGNAVNNTGFSPNSSAEGGRLANKDGRINLRKTGVPLYERISLYHALLHMGHLTFTLTVFAIYTCLNLSFAMLYYFIGIENLRGTSLTGSFLDDFLQAFFFSSQTLTTVGYGHISPVGFVTNVIASLESFIGIMSFALVTGMFYARFSRPSAYIRFSPNFLVAPFKGGKALMFRLATYKNNHLTDADAQVTMAVHVQENGKTVTKFYPLTLEISHINSLALSWTIVHPLDEKSPLADYTKQDFIDCKIEMLITIKAFDDHFSNTVQQRTSYTQDEMVYGARFLPMYARSEDGNYTNLMLEKINHYEKVDLGEH
ncbi:ion channel [Dyadobacter arcticus]|uniref:Inward rectifier potassium channel n=1 Tax=Dyadobacter arcticus TaxID=1078754 RepID=A0ABX0UFN0_9BACT|nr:ion channel [Dyadobacter arcticus]NIJ51814.1 inward rectifier potassium channel [Dyadobacter arcticus]